LELDYFQNFGLI